MASDLGREQFTTLVFDETMVFQNTGSEERNNSSSDTVCTGVEATIVEWKYWSLGKSPVWSHRWLSPIFFCACSKVFDGESFGI